MRFESLDSIVYIQLLIISMAGYPDTMKIKAGDRVTFFLWLAMMLLPLAALADDDVGLWEKAKSAVSKGWEVTTDSAEDAAEWSSDKAKQAASATGKQSKKVLKKAGDTVKKGAGKAADWVKEKTE